MHKIALAKFLRFDPYQCIAYLFPLSALPLSKGKAQKGAPVEAEEGSLRYVDSSSSVPGRV